MHSTTMKQLKSLVAGACVAAASTGLADTINWVGESGNWSDAANWQNTAQQNVVPAAGDDVVIDATVTVTLDGAESTPALNSLTVGGGAAESKLLFVKWDAALVATTVTVADKGVLTCQGAESKSDIGRVWIKATDVTVDAGGKIDVDGCGYAAPVYKSGIKNGFGPGGTYTYGVGASHGGLGAFNHFSLTRPIFIKDAPKGAFGTLLYDDSAAPVEPGSSGMSSNYGRGGFGGGCVRIEATGRVTVNGIVSASATDSTSYESMGIGHATGGSGGSVYITCQTFAGCKGAVRANGGGGYYAIDNVTGGPMDYQDAAGGGGMIAIHYDTSAQTAGLVQDVAISAMPGMYKGIGNWKGKVGLSTLDKHYMDAELGTLSFSDEKLLVGLGKCLSGRILGFPQYTCDNLVFTNGFVRFCGEGVKFTVTGDLVITGATARLDLGELHMTNRVCRKEVYVGKTKTELTVGGNLFVADDARLDIRAAETNAPGCWGAEITVGGDMTVGTNGNVYAWCEMVNGGAPNFSVGKNFSVLEGGLMSAEKRGFAGGHNYSNGSTWFQQYWNRRGRGYGPGAGREDWNYVWGTGSKQVYIAIGGAHGGRGGWSTMTNKTTVANSQPYDDPWMPSFPGSGGGCYGYAPAGGTGGGIIRVVAKGKLRVDGEINADGASNWLVKDKNKELSDSPSGAGAGGTVFLRGRMFAGAASGVISAKGGNATGVSASAGAGEGAGGGGRIAVWVGEVSAKPVPAVRQVRSLEPIAIGKSVFKGVTRVDGGVNHDFKSPDVVDEFVSTDGTAGTVGFVRVKPVPGLSVALW